MSTNISTDSPSAANDQQVNTFRARFLPNVDSHPQVPIPARRLRAKKQSAPVQIPLPEGGLPPWGRMDERLEAKPDFAIIPIDWRVKDGELPTRDDWQVWVDKIVADISWLLWPEYNPSDNSSWRDTRIADLLTADFKLLDDLHDNFELPIPSEHPTQVFHSELFNEEDDGSTPFGTGYDRYDPSLSPRSFQDLPDVLAAGMADKVGTLDLQLKKRFQRPRAYQVALLQGRQDYHYRWARTGNSPSLVSGHCLQASLAGTTAFVALRSVFGSNVAAMTALAQLTVDIGDRRVYAGVHYPSDNLASWYVAMNLIPHVFDSLEMKSSPALFLWKAISMRSDVYNAIRGYDAERGGKSPYTEILAALEKLGAEAEKSKDTEPAPQVSPRVFI